MAVSKRQLLASRLPEEDVELPGLGTVRVRALSRAQALEVRGDGTTGSFERAMVSMSLVAPVLTPDEVGQWQQGSMAGELEVVTRRIRDLSGLGKEAAKDAYKEFEASPDAEFRALPGGEAVDDGGQGAGGDE